MPRKTAVKTAKPRVKTVKISFVRPASLPEDVKLPEGSTIASLCDHYNIETSSYSFSVGGDNVGSSYVLNSNDIVRVGIKQKNG